jgi:hypothetical protein
VLPILCGCATSTVASGLYGRFDQSLAPFDWWAYYTKRLATQARRWLCVGHAVVGLVSGLVLALFTHWYPFGHSVGAVALGGLTWSALGEALFRAEAAALDLGRAKPGVSLLRKALAQRFELLERTVANTVDDRILQEAQTPQGLLDLLIRLLGLEANPGSIGTAGAAAAVETWSRRLGSPDQSVRNAARVEGLQVAKSVVVEKRLKL